jgi:hypothetical protein
VKKFLSQAQTQPINDESSNQLSQIKETEHEANSQYQNSYIDQLSEIEEGTYRGQER